LTSARERSHVPVDLPVGDHAAFLWMAVATHALVGYTLGKVLLDESAWGGCWVASPPTSTCSSHWPGSRRSSTAGLPTPRWRPFSLAVLAARWRRSAGLAVGTAYASHLAIDATTPAGVALFYPSRPFAWTSHSVATRERRRFFSGSRA